MTHRGPHFDGPEYNPVRDGKRLRTQLDRVRWLMIDGQWRTLEDIGALTGDPITSISAQLRHLRKPRFGAYTVERKVLFDGLYAYRVVTGDLRSISTKQQTTSVAQLKRRIDQLSAEIELLHAKLANSGCLFCRGKK